MDRRGGMAPMMPFFPGSGLNDQPPQMPAPDMPPFPHMRERFPNSVWAPDGTQGQWGAFHPPGLAAPPMGPPGHTAHQYNQFEPRQAVFNFSGSSSTQTQNPASVTQFNNGFAGQYNGNPETVTGYVPQGHFSPQTTTTSVPYSSGAPSAFLGQHPQGNGLINATNVHPYPPSNDYSQQGIFKSPMPSPAVSGTDQSPIQSVFTVSAMPSPHTSNNQNEQTIVPCQQVAAYPNHPTADCAASLPQSSPLSNAAPCNSMGNNNAANVNSSVQSRLKTMIMSRQGTTGSHGSAFSPGLSDSPPPGELRFSGSVAAVTSVESSPDPSQVQESIKMAQNFLAYRTADPGPGSVVQLSSDDKGDLTVNQKSDSGVVNKNGKSDCDNIVTNFNSSLQPNETISNNLNNDPGNSMGRINPIKIDKSLPNKPDNNFKQPEEALEELFNGTKIDTFLNENNNTHSLNTDQIFSRDNNFISSDADSLNNNNVVPNVDANCDRAFLKPGTTDKRQPSTNTDCEYLNRCRSANAIMVQNESQSCNGSYSIENRQKPNISEPAQNVVRSEKGKSISLSVYDFPDSPDQQPTAQKGGTGFRLGRVRGAGLPITTTTTHCRPACASAPLCGSNNIPTNTQAREDGESEQAKVDGILLDDTIPPSLLHPQPFGSHISSASALSSTINPQYANFLPTTTVNSSCSTIPSLVGKDGHSSLHNKQNCISQSFQKQNIATISNSAKMSPLNQRQQVENFSSSDTSTNSAAKSCGSFSQISAQVSHPMTGTAKINNNLSISQQSYNAFHAQQRAAMFNLQNQPHFPQSSTATSFLPCNNMPPQPQSNLPFNLQAQSSFNPKTGMPHSMPPGSYGPISNQPNSTQNSFFYQHGHDNKMQMVVDSAKSTPVLPLQNMQQTITPSSLESLQRISKNADESQNVSPQQSPKSATEVSPIAHSTPVSNAPQPLPTNTNHSSNQNIPHISPTEGSSPQEMTQLLPQNIAPSHASIQSMPFGMLQGISNSTSMPISQQPHNPLQALPNTSPVNMPHPSPQNISHPSPHNIPSHISPHPSPQSMPLSSPQNVSIHTSPQNLSHISQNLPHQCPQTISQQQPSPQNFNQSVQPTLPQTSPQNISRPSPQSIAQPHNNTIHPTETISQQMSVNINSTPHQQGAAHLQHNLVMKTSQPSPQSMMCHPHNAQQAVSFVSTAQNMSGSNFSRPSHCRPPLSPYSMAQSPAQTMNNSAHVMHPSFPSNYPPYGMPYQPMNHGYQHRMYPPMHMPPGNQAFPNCQHPIKSISNIAMPQTIMQPSLSAEPTPATKSRPKKGAPKKPRKQKETKQQKQQKADNEKGRLQELNPQALHSFCGKEAMLSQQNAMMVPSQLCNISDLQPNSNDHMQAAPISKQGLMGKIDHFPPQPMQFQPPQSWHPAMGPMHGNPNNFYPDQKTFVPPNKQLQQNNARCFPNREDYIPLNMLNQQQSDIFKNVFDDSKTSPSIVSKKFDLPKTPSFNTPVNNLIGVNSSLCSKSEESTEGATPKVIPNIHCEPTSNPLTTPTQINHYYEQALIEKQMRQENQLTTSVTGEPDNKNNCISPNKQNRIKSEFNVDTKNQYPDQVLSNYVHEEVEHQNQSHIPIPNAILYPHDKNTSCPTGEIKTLLPISQNQNPLKIEEKSPQPEDENMDIEQIKNRMKANELLVPKCSCVIPPGTPDSGPVYTHLGAGSSVASIREKIKKQTGHDEDQIRIEKVLFSGKDGKTESGCPLPKWIIRRSGQAEKVLIVVKERLEHTCNFTWIVIVIVAWEGFPSSSADNLYSVLVEKLNKFGNPTERRCGTNEDRTCACQGENAETCGASYSFGCSWSMYYNMCKFARSKNTRKFKLTDEKEEKEVEEKLQCIATTLGPVYERMAPIAYQHQVALEEESLECRLGKEAGRPWTGVTACMDFCSHAHKDSHNIHNGCTVLATLTKGHGTASPPTNLREQTPPDEQLHVLPLYLLDTKHENGNVESFDQKVKTGAIETLTKYPFPMRLRSEPLLSCRARTLLARGLPLPNSIRGKAKAKAKVVSLANIRRKSSGDNTPMKKKQKSDVKEVTDKLGLDVDYLLGSGDLEDNYDDFSKYSIDSDDYSWILDLGNDDDSTKNTLNSQQELKEESKEIQKESKIMSGYSAKIHTSESTGTMPPPECPAPRRANSPGALGSQQHSVLSPAVSPSLVLNLQPQVDSPPPVLTPVPNLSPFSPQMPHLSPHGSHSSPDSPRKTTQNSEICAVPSSLPDIANSLAISHASLFAASHNSPEMPRLSPHVTLGAFSPIGVPRSGEKVSVSNMKQLSIKQPLNSRSQSQSEHETKPDEQQEEGDDTEDKSKIIEEEFSPSFLENKDGPHIFTRHSDNYQSFQDPNVGGVGIALTHGSVLFEYARQELHSTTALRNPNRKDPKRISLVFYHHKNLIYRNHGMREFEEKMEKKRSAAEKDEKEGIVAPTKKRKSNKKNKDDKDKMEPLNGIKRMKFDLEEGHLIPENKNGHQLNNKCATAVFPTTHMHIPHHPELISPPISYANYPHILPSFVDGNRPYSPSGTRNCNTPAFSLASKSPHIVTSQSPSLDTYSQKPIPTPDHNYGTSAAPNHPNILPPFNTNLQEFHPYTGRGPSPYPGHYQPYMEMSANNFSSYQPSGYFPKGHAPPINYNTTTYVPQPFYGLTPPYSPGPQPHNQSVGTVQSQMPFAPTLTQPITNPFDDSMRSGPSTNPTPTWSQMRHTPSFHIHGAYSAWPGS